MPKKATPKPATKKVAKVTQGAQPKSLPDGEQNLRETIPVFVNSFNQPTYLKESLQWFARNGFGNVTVLDNNSQSPELLAYFASPEFNEIAKLVQLQDNIGPRKALAFAASDAETENGFIFTDPDLLLPEPAAPNLLTRMFEVGRRHGYIKVGLALSIDPDLVDGEMVTYKTRTVHQVERKYWKNAVEPGVFVATTDTTFFLYVPKPGDGKRFNDYGTRQARIPSIRIGTEGFIALHRPWLKQDTVAASELLYYRESCKPYSTLTMAQFGLAADKAENEASKLPRPVYTPDRPRAAAAQIRTLLLNALDEACNGQVRVIQVGANDGKMDDPIYPYLKNRGWPALLIEPHPVYFSELELCHSNHPNVELRNVAISAAAGSMELFHLNEAARSRFPVGLRGCASLEKARLEDALQRASKNRSIELQDSDITSTQVTVRRLDDLIADTPFTKADLLVIDVEGHELAVLDSFDLASLNPLMAIIECNGLNRRDETRIAARMSAANLGVFRLGGDLIGLNPSALSVSLPAFLAFLRLPRLA